MKVLFVSVHPDDETLGCGGTIIKHKKNGDDIYWMIITEANQSEGYSKEFVEARKLQIDKISDFYKFDKVSNLGFPAAKLQNVDFNDIVDKIATVMNSIKPQIVYTVNRSDVHTDHQVAAKAVFSCTKTFRYPFIKRILMYECLSETEMAPALHEAVFIPNVFSDISEYLDYKLEAMSIYETEVKSPPFPRSLENIKALARYRGSTAGVDYAEAFMLIRDVF